MAKKETIIITDEDMAEIEAMLYDARMRQYSMPVPSTNGWYVRQPITPSMLKGKQRCDEIGYHQQRKISIEKQIEELQSRLQEL